MNFVLVHDEARRRAIEAVQTAPHGYHVKVKAPIRSLEQNALLWELLTKVANNIQWPVDGELQRISKEDWKDIFTAALKHSQRAAKGIDGGYVMLGSRTSRMTKRELSDLVELIQAFMAERGM